jgi:hypothetical protein
MADKTVPMRLKAEPSCSIATAKNISKTNSLLYTSAAAAILKTSLSATAAMKVGIPSRGDRRLRPSARVANSIGIEIEVMEYWSATESKGHSQAISLTEETKSC